MTRKPENTETLSFTGVSDASSGVISKPGPLVFGTQREPAGVSVRPRPQK